MCDSFNATTYCSSGNGTNVAAAFARGCPGNQTLTAGPDCMACTFETDAQRQTFLQTYSDVVGGNAGVQCVYTPGTGATSGAARNARPSRSHSSWSFAKIGTLLLAVVAASSFLGGAAASPLSADDASLLKLHRRANEKCTGFRISSQAPSYSPSAQVGGIVVCNGNSAPCPVSSTGEKKTISASFVSYSSGAVEGINVAAIFGPNYTDSQQVQAINGYRVPVNQAAYLSVTSKSTLFRGTFTGCSNGDQPGEANVPLVNKHITALVITQG